MCVTLSVSLTATFDGYIPWTADVHTYSIDDFLQVRHAIVQHLIRVCLISRSHADQVKTTIPPIATARLYKTRQILSRKYHPPSPHLTGSFFSIIRNVVVSRKGVCVRVLQPV